METDHVLFALFFVGFFVAIGYAAGTDVEEAKYEDQRYREMVCLGRETDQQFGWPNYKNLEISCNNFE